MSVLAPVSKSFSVIARFWKAVATIPAALLTITGIASVAGGIVSSQMIEDRGLALTAIGLGSFIGATLLSLYFPKVLYGVQQKTESGLQEVKVQLAQAREEISRLQRTKINVESFKAISKLALIELDLSVRDYKRTPIQLDAETLFRKERQFVYSGLLRIPVKAHLGIDLSKLKVQVKNGDLIVGNLVTSHLYEPGTTEWEFDEVRVEQRKEGSVVEVKIDPLDHRSKDYARLHEAEIRDRIKEGVYIRAYEEPMLLKHAENVVRQLLAPLGMPITFSRGELSAGVDLQDFLAAGASESTKALK